MNTVHAQKLFGKVNKRNNSDKCLNVTRNLIFLFYKVILFSQTQVHTAQQSAFYAKTNLKRQSLTAFQS